jgi:Fic family protein
LSSLTPRFLDSLRFSAADASQLRALGEARGRQQLFARRTPEFLATLKTAAIIESTESSNRIEGVTAPRARIDALIIERGEPRDQSEQEIAGYRDALKLIHDSAEHMTFSVNVILQLHAMLYSYHGGSGGRWKMTQNEIVERDSSGKMTRIQFVPPGPVETPQLMHDLVDRYASALDAARDPLIIAPLAILDFLCVHPFSDGNGRTSRLLTLQLLYRAKLDVGRFISLERIVEQSKETYYEALERSSQRWSDGAHDALPWLRYFWGMTLRAYKEFEERAGSIRAGRGAKTDMVEHAVMRRVGPFAISDIEIDTPGVSRDWIRMVLRRWKAEGKIVAQGKGRGARWVRVEPRA